VLESFNASFFSVSGTSEGTAVDDGSVDDVLVSGISDPSSEEDEPPPKRPFSLPSDLTVNEWNTQEGTLGAYLSENHL
jgi:hypothetical protein